MKLLGCRLSFHRQPRCPLCQRDLSADSWMALYGYAWCAECYWQFQSGRLSDCALSLNRSRNPKYWTVAHGIRFYCPHPNATRNRAAHLDEHLGGPCPDPTPNIPRTSPSEAQPCQPPAPCA